MNSTRKVGREVQSKTCFLLPRNIVAPPGNANKRWGMEGKRDTNALTFTAFHDSPLRHLASGRRDHERSLDLIPSFLVRGLLEFPQVNDPSDGILYGVISSLVRIANEIVRWSADRIETDEYVENSIGDTILSDRPANALLIANSLDLHVDRARVALSKEIDGFSVSQRDCHRIAAAIKFCRHEIFACQMRGVAVDIVGHPSLP